MPFIADDPTSWLQPEALSLEIVLLDKMAALLADENHWCKKDFSDEIAGYSSAYCLIGALYQVSHGEPNRNDCDRSSVDNAVESALLCAIGLEEYDDWEGIAEFNDDDVTSHADILKAIRDARNLLAGSSTGSKDDAVR